MAEIWLNYENMNDKISEDFLGILNPIKLKEALIIITVHQEGDALSTLQNIQNKLI